MASSEETEARELGNAEDVLSPADPVVQRTGLAARSRAEHLAWCKARALEYVDRENLQDAFASMASDLNSHPETKGHPGVELGMMGLIFGRLGTAAEMRRFINDFN